MIEHEGKEKKMMQGKKNDDTYWKVQHKLEWKPLVTPILSYCRPTPVRSSKSPERRDKRNLMGNSIVRSVIFEYTHG